jgi:hypothetical protein
MTRGLILRFRRKPSDGRERSEEIRRISAGTPVDGVPPRIDCLHRAGGRSPGPGSLRMKIAAGFSLERIAAFDKAARAGEYPNARTIARALEVGPRTVQRDVEFMRDRPGAPLAFDPRRNGYYYAEPDYRLPLMSLTEGELVAFFLAERALQQYQQYRGTPYAADLARAFRKVTLGLSDRVTVDLDHLGDLHPFRTTASPGVTAPPNAVDLAIR